MSGSAPEGSVKSEKRKCVLWLGCQRRFQGGGGFELSLGGQWDLVRLRGTAEGEDGERQKGK